jgi:hypothetical protein
MRHNMHKHLIYLAISLLCGIDSFAICQSKGSRPDSINDGPYIFYLNSRFVAKWVENNILKTDYIKLKNFAETRKKFNLLFDYSDLSNNLKLKPDYDQVYCGVDSIAAICDIHGGFNGYIKLMKSLGIIDNNLNWKFGSGHLVVLGDSFDRGDMVTEVLWHLFGLEKQAAKAGGMVHMLLGNHETLMLRKDMRYTNEKYFRVQAITGIDYSDLYSEESVLGKWLRYQPVIISLDDILFVHGGISIEMVRRKMKIEEINRIFSNMTVGTEFQSDNELADLKFLNKEDGPIWYRGYFTETSYCESKIDSILKFYDKKHIVVGHTVSGEIKPLFDSKIFGIDAGLGNDQSGAMLIYKDGLFYQGLVTGERIKL